MRLVHASTLLLSTILTATAAFAGPGENSGKPAWGSDSARPQQAIQLGPRPYFLIADMDESPLKERLESCSEGPFKRSDFSIGHRGAALQFPEHTRESYAAAARQGAGIVECDVTFTSDRELVCRHSQCDLHTTTNILSIPDLAAKCSLPFEPATFDENGNQLTSARARCCTSDITLAEFRQLKGKMDASNPRATTPEEYQGGTATYRTELYASRGTLLTHAESIELFKQLGVKMTPELKSPSVEMPFDSDGDGVGDYTQSQYAQQMIDEYKAAGVAPENVWPQSFDIGDVLYWIAAEPQFGEQAVYLDGRYGEPGFDHRDPATWTPSMSELVSAGVKVIAPPIYMLVEVENGAIVPSLYAREARNAGLDIIAWTFERSGLLASGGGFYYQSVNGDNPNPVSPEPGVIDNDGDMLEVLDVLAQDVGILGLFSDWPASVTYYANCMKLK